MPLKKAVVKQGIQCEKLNQQTLGKLLQANSRVLDRLCWDKRRLSQVVQLNVRKLEYPVLTKIGELQCLILTLLVKSGTCESFDTQRLFVW